MRGLDLLSDRGYGALVMELERIEESLNYDSDIIESLDQDSLDAFADFVVKYNMIPPEVGMNPDLRVEVRWKGFRSEMLVIFAPDRMESYLVKYDGGKSVSESSVGDAEYTAKQVKNYLKNTY